MDNLPYETQFKFLVNLPLRDIINYCKTGTTSYAICQTEAFWRYKARKVFGIDLDVISYGKKTPARKYETLHDLYYNNPELLIVYLVEGEDLSQIPVLFNKILDIDNQCQVFSNALITAIMKGSVPLVQQVLTMFRNVYINLAKEDLDDLFRDAFFREAIKDHMDLVNILKIYYNPNTDGGESIYEWLWQYEQDPKTVALLEKAGVSFDRLAD